MLLVRDILRHDAVPVIELAADEPIESAVALMGFAGLPALVLIDGRRRAVALLTERDIVDYFATPGFETGCKAARVARSAPNDELPQCSSCDRLSTVVRRMNEENLRAVLVVDGGAGLGLLTQDVVAAAIAKAETEEPL